MINQAELKSQQYFEVVLKQLGLQRPRIYQGRVSAQIFQPRSSDKIQKGILNSSSYFLQFADQIRKKAEIESKSKT
ncbi:hypothetical protein GQ457_12G013210 [Hibiscus cannabinus]